MLAGGGSAWADTLETWRDLWPGGSTLTRADASCCPWQGLEDRARLASGPPRASRRVALQGRGPVQHRSGCSGAPEGQGEEARGVQVAGVPVDGPWFVRTLRSGLSPWRWGEVLRRMARLRQMLAGCPGCTPAGFTPKSPNWPLNRSYSHVKFRGPVFTDTTGPNLGWATYPPGPRCRAFRTR
jgi:hypothetical protein